MEQFCEEQHGVEITPNDCVCHYQRGSVFGLAFYNKEPWEAGVYPLVFLTWYDTL